jgi:hypothetical protein
VELVKPCKGGFDRVNTSRYLTIGIVVGMAVGAFVCYTFLQFSQISNLQTQIEQLELENSQLKTNNTELIDAILEIQSAWIGFPTNNVGKAIAIQSVTRTYVFVQNVGNSTVTLTDVYVDGDLVTQGVDYSIDNIDMQQGDTSTITFTNELPTPQVTVKVVTTDGTSAEYTKTFP